MRFIKNVRTQKAHQKTFTDIYSPCRKKGREREGTRKKCHMPIMGETWKERLGVSTAWEDRGNCRISQIEIFQRVGGKKRKTDIRSLLAYHSGRVPP